MAKKAGKNTANDLTTGRLIELIKGFPPDTPVVGIFAGQIINMDGAQEILFNKEKCDKRKFQIGFDHHQTWPEMRLHTEDADTFGVFLTYK